MIEFITNVKTLQISIKLLQIIPSEEIADLKYVCLKSTMFALRLKCKTTVFTLEFVSKPNRLSRDQQLPLTTLASVREGVDKSSYIH